MFVQVKDYFAEFFYPQQKSPFLEKAGVIKTREMKSMP